MKRSNSTLIIVPCGKRKVWDREPNSLGTRAKYAYISPYFKLCSQYAERFSDKWVIISAKYGFIEPDFIISGNYDVSFKKPQSKPVSVKVLTEQADSHNFNDFDKVVSLGGKNYTELIRLSLKPLELDILAPLTGLNIFQRQSELKRSLINDVEL